MGRVKEKFINGNFPDTTDDPRLYEERNEKFKQQQFELIAKFCRPFPSAYRLEQQKA